MAPPSYHLWLKPSGEAYASLASLIRDLAKELKGPVFEPHVTLLGNVTGEEQALIGQTKKLAAALEPFQITLAAPDYRETYFQCLFLHAVETDILLGTHTAARRLFEHAPVIAEKGRVPRGKSPSRRARGGRVEVVPGVGGCHYMPHLSLVYGSYPVERKRKVIDGLPEDLPKSIDVNAVSLIRTESDDPEDWHEVCAPQLGSAAKEQRFRTT